MSKPVTNEEVEDVLSSIRRLVSEDKRPLAGLRAAPPVAVSEAQAEEVDARYDARHAKPASGRLVLTPALRVAEGPKDTSDTDADAPLDLGSIARETWDPSGAEHEQATVEDAKAYKGPMKLFPAAQDSVSEDDRDAAMDALDALVHDAIEAELETMEESVNEAGDYSTEDYWDDDESIAEPDYAQTHDADVRFNEDSDWEEDEVSAAQVDALRQGEDMIDPAEPETMDAAHIGPDDRSARKEGEPSRRFSASVLPLTAKIAALEAAVDEIPTDWEPDGDKTDDFAFLNIPAMAWEDDVELDAKGKPLVSEPENIGEGSQPEETIEPVQAESAPAGPASNGDDQLMDEEALRDLVSEMVRAELQGALGERITRNVRKLVRREIHRALTAQELE